MHLCLARTESVCNVPTRLQQQTISNDTEGCLTRHSKSNQIGNKAPNCGKTGATNVISEAFVAPRKGVAVVMCWAARGCHAARTPHAVTQPPRSGAAPAI